MNKRLRPKCYCIVDRKGLKGFAALWVRSVNWNKSKTGKTPRMAVKPVYNTSDLTLTSVTNQGAHRLIFYDLTSAIVNNSHS